MRAAGWQTGTSVAIRGERGSYNGMILGAITTKECSYPG